MSVGRRCSSFKCCYDRILFRKERPKQFYETRTIRCSYADILTMAIAQSLIVTLGNIFLLGVDVQNPVYSVSFAVLIALAFMMIVYVLAALFDNVGKGIAIIILVLSISGGGGTIRSKSREILPNDQSVLAIYACGKLVAGICRRHLLAKCYESNLDHDRFVCCLWNRRNGNLSVHRRKMTKFKSGA